MNTEAIKSLAQSIIDATKPLPDARIAERQISRATRIEMYADWLAHDADGLAFNLANPSGQPIEGATAVLAEARASLALALHRIDLAIEADRAANQEPVA